MDAALGLATPTRPRCLAMGRRPLHEASRQGQAAPQAGCGLFHGAGDEGNTLKGILATLSRATGKSIPALLDEALEVLQEQERLHHPADEAPSPPAARPKSLGEIAAELFGEIPEEELARLPVDGAAQHDHYIYGLPKRTR